MLRTWVLIVFHCCHPTPLSTAVNLQIKCEPNEDDPSICRRCTRLNYPCEFKGNGRKHDKRKNVADGPTTPFPPAARPRLLPPPVTHAVRPVTHAVRPVRAPWGPTVHTSAAHEAALDPFVGFLSSGAGSKFLGQFGIGGGVSVEDTLRALRDDIGQHDQPVRATRGSAEGVAPVRAPTALSFEEGLRGAALDLPGPLEHLRGAEARGNCVLLEHEVNGVLVGTYINESFQEHIAPLAEFRGRKGLCVGEDGLFHHPNVHQAGLPILHDIFFKLKAAAEAAAPAPAQHGAAWPGCVQRVASCSATVPLWHRTSATRAPCAHVTGKLWSHFEGAFTLVLVDGAPGSGHECFHSSYLGVSFPSKPVSGATSEDTEPKVSFAFAKLPLSTASSSSSSSAAAAASARVFPAHFDPFEDVESLLLFGYLDDYWASVEAGQGSTTA